MKHREPEEGDDAGLLVERAEAMVENLEHGAGFCTPPELNRILERVTPKSSEGERRGAVEKVLEYLEYLESLRGDWVPLVQEDLFRRTAERTGYSFETLLKIAEDHETCRRKEERERAFELAVGMAQTELKAREIPVSTIAEKLGKAADTYRLRGEDEEEPPPFSVDRLDRESRETPAGRRSGWGAVDKLEVRFCPGELALLGARTGHGKTSFLVGLLLNWLKVQEAGLLVFYSAEEREVRIYHRLLALLARKDGGNENGWTANTVRDFLRDEDSHSDWPIPEPLHNARDRLRSWEDRLLVVHRPGWDVEKLAAHARSVADAGDVGAVLVDYLQRVPPPARPYDRRDIAVSAVARSLKALAEDLRAPVVVGAQINREAVKGKDVPEGSFDDEKVRKAIRSRRPRLHHLREGGSEQEADLVLGLLNYRADFETDEEGERKEGVSVPEATPFEVGTLKNRYGEVGKWARLAFEGRFHLLRDPESYEGDL